MEVSRNPIRWVEALIGHVCWAELLVVFPWAQACRLGANESHFNFPCPADEELEGLARQPVIEQRSSWKRCGAVESCCAVHELAQVNAYLCPESTRQACLVMLFARQYSPALAKIDGRKIRSHSNGS